MGAVAEGRFFRVLAGAPSDGAGFGDFHFFRGHCRSLMGAVAEGLVGGASASAPPIDAGRRWRNDGRLLKDFWSCHKFCWLGKNEFPPICFVSQIIDCLVGDCKEKKRRGNSSLVFG